MANLIHAAKGGKFRIVRNFAGRNEFIGTLKNWGAANSEVSFENLYAETHDTGCRWSFVPA